MNIDLDCIMDEGVTSDTDINTSVIISDEDKYELKSDASPYILQLRDVDCVDEKNYKKFVGSCKRMIRMSPEYKLWTDYLREVLGFYSCSITGEVNSQTTVEIHHHPIPMEVIIKGVLNRRMGSKTGFCSFDIITEVIELHFKNHIGYIPIVSSLHEKFHNGFLDIPMEMVNGNYKKYLEQFGTFLEDDDLSTIQERISITKQSCGWNHDYGWVKNVND